MALIVDIILVIVLLCCVYVGWKNGFIKTLSGFFSYVLSFALANVLDDLCVPLVRKIPILSRMITEGAEMPDFTGSMTFLDKMKVLLRFLSEDLMADGNAQATQIVIKNCLAEILIAIIAFIILFVVFVILIKLLLWALDFLIRKIRDKQVILTTCESEALFSLDDARMIRVQNGNYLEMGET